MITKKIIQAIKSLSERIKTIEEILDEGYREHEAQMKAGPDPKIKHTRKF